MPERELTFAQAVREALAEEMRRDSRVCIFGEDVAEAGTHSRCFPGWLRNSVPSACSTLQSPKRDLLVLASERR